MKIKNLIIKNINNSQIKNGIKKYIKFILEIF